MIFYGTKGAHIQSKNVPNLKCNHCENQTTHTISIYGRYFYIYWIPVIPIGKKGFSECNHCKATYEPSQMSESVKRAYQNLKKETKTPLTHWSGLLIIACLIGFAIYSAQQHKKDMVTYIESPQINDIIEYKSSNKAYSTLKVTRTTSDSVFFVANSMEISRKSKLYKIDKTENYNAERFGMSLTEYKEAFETKQFLDIER